MVKNRIHALIKTGRLEFSDALRLATLKKSLRKLALSVAPVGNPCCSGSGPLPEQGRKLSMHRLRFGRAVADYYFGPIVEG